MRVAIVAGMKTIAIISCLAAIAGCTPRDPEDLDPAVETFAAGTLCRHYAESFEDCPQQSSSDASLAMSCWTASTTASSYGSTSCDSQFVVDIEPGQTCTIQKWSRISATRSFFTPSKCDCEDYVAYIKLIGSYGTEICAGIGCDPSCEGNDGCQRYCIMDPGHEQTETARATYNASTQRCTVATKILNDSTLCGWDVLYEAHAAVVNTRTGATAPVTVAIVPGTF